jgi:hypothetical protein
VNVLAGSSTSVSVNIPLADGMPCAPAAASTTDPRVTPDMMAASSVPLISTVKVRLTDSWPSEAVIVKLSVVGAFSALMASLFGT